MGCSVGLAWLTVGCCVELTVLRAGSKELGSATVSGNEAHSEALYGEIIDFITAAACQILNTGTYSYYSICFVPVSLGQTYFNYQIIL